MSYKAWKRDPIKVKVVLNFGLTVSRHNSIMDESLRIALDIFQNYEGYLDNGLRESSEAHRQSCPSPLGYFSG